MVDQLISVDTDGGVREPLPVSIFAAGQIVDFSGLNNAATDPNVAARLGDVTTPATGTVNQRLGLINATLGSPLQAGGSVAVSNFPASQPISAAALPLPTGAATSALQTSMGATLTSLDGKAGPSAAAASAIVPAVAQAATGLLLKASPGNLYSASMTAGATAGYLIAYNATAVPASGATLTASLLLNAIAVGANGFASLGGNPVPDRFGVGIVLLFSTSLATYTVPANPAIFLRGSAL